MTKRTVFITLSLVLIILLFYYVISVDYSFKGSRVTKKVNDSQINNHKSISFKDDIGKSILPEGKNIKNKEDAIHNMQKEKMRKSKGLEFEKFVYNPTLSLEEQIKYALRNYSLEESGLLEFIKSRREEIVPILLKIAGGDEYDELLRNDVIGVLYKLKSKELNQVLLNMLVTSPLEKYGSNKDKIAEYSELQSKAIIMLGEIKDKQFIEPLIRYYGKQDDIPIKYRAYITGDILVSLTQMAEYGDESLISFFRDVEAQDTDSSNRALAKRGEMQTDILTSPYKDTMLLDALYGKYANDGVSEEWALKNLMKSGNVSPRLLVSHLRDALEGLRSRGDPYGYEDEFLEAIEKSGGELSKEEKECLQSEK